MSNATSRLSAVRVARLSKPGLYSDGGGLYLQITSAGVKSWLFRYMRQGRAHGMGLGPLHTISLADARVRALEARRKLLDGTDPLEARRTEQTAARLRDRESRTFDECATDYINSHAGGWKSHKHAEQWRNTLVTYASPSIGALDVSEIDTALIMAVLEPIWRTKTETASRLRNRIELILDWAGVRGYRRGDNPARWRGHLDKLLPKPAKVKRVQHHPALPYAQAGGFVTELQAHEGTAARALEFLILTATRTSETICAAPDEFDLKAALWTIPASRMKGAKEHRVPLSPRALSIVAPLIDAALRDKRAYVFPGGRANRPLSNMAMLALLKRMNRPDLTVHGFRSTFRDWAGETTHFPREVIEAALAHKLRDQAEAAYARGDLFVKRAKLMAQWAAYVGRVAKAI